MLIRIFEVLDNKELNNMELKFMYMELKFM
jgi:hypothetical protein